MKNLKNVYVVLALLAFLGLNACSSSTDASPDLASQVAGTYNLVQMTSGGLVITPATLVAIKGTLEIKVVRTASSTGTMSVILKSPVANSSETAPISFTSGTGGTINVLEAGQSIGTYTAGVLRISSKDDTGAVYSLEAKK